VTRGAATEAAHNLSDAASRIGHNARGATRDLAQFCTEEPVVVAGLGFALGAVMGAALPTSEAEDRLVGDASDAIKGNVREQAADLSHKAQNVARATIEAASQAAGDGQSAEHGQSGGEPVTQQPAAGGDGSGPAAPGAG